MKLIVTLIAVAVLGGCSSLPMQKAQNDTRVVCDATQMAAVDHSARSLRTEVIWINCPLTHENAKSVS